MTALVICRGLPASGKSTWANTWVAADPKFRVRVNRDTIRVMLYDDKFIPGITEGRVIKARDAMIDVFLAAGVSVVCDDTNLRAKVVKDLMRIARKNQAEVRFQDFDVVLNHCIDRDNARAQGHVGAEVIRGMHDKYLRNGFPPIPALESDVPVTITYVPDETKPKAFIFDIDGTLAIHDGRSPYDESKVHLDLPNTRLFAIMYQLKVTGNEIIIVSGRRDSCRDATQEWLMKNTWDAPVITHLGDNTALVTVQEKPWWHLHMRPASMEGRADYLVKLALFNTHILHDYHVIGVFDDRDQVVRLWRQLGLLCCQVNYGEF